MVAIAADDALKARCQEARVVSFQTFQTNRANEQVRKYSRQTQHPYVEVARCELDCTALFQRAHCHSNKPKDRILRLAFRQKPIHQFHQMTGTYGAIVILEEL